VYFIFLSDGRPPNVAGPEVTYPLPHPFGEPAYGENLESLSHLCLDLYRVVTDRQTYGRTDRPRQNYDS